MFRELGCSELDVGDGTTGTVLTDLTVSYTAEAFLFDRLTVESGVDEVGGTSIRVHQRMLRTDKQIALAECGLAAFDYSVRKLARFPEALLDRLRARAHGSS
jgi:acyl-CoA thioesterase FadM